MNEPSDPYIHYMGLFKEAKDQARTIAEPLDNRVFRRKPSSKTWCVGECFSHLVEAGSLYLEKIQEGMASAGEGQREGPAEDPMHLRFHMKWFVRYLEPPVFLKSPAPYSFRPRAYAKLEKDEILTQYLRLQDRYIAALEQARSRKLNLGNLYVPNPVTAIIKMSVAECFAVSEAHQRRHLAQARQIIAEVS